jgi:hypothetical protein
MNEKLDKQFFDVNFNFHGNKYEPIKNIGKGFFVLIIILFYSNMIIFFKGMVHMV